MKATRMLISIGGFLIFILANQCFYTLDETEQAIILEFGKPVGKSITDAGLHFKVPFIQKVTVFDKRFLEWDGDAKQVPTAEKTYIWVDTFARWRIADPLKFYQRVTNEISAQSRLDDIINSAVRTFVSENLLIELVRNSNRELQSSIDISVTALGVVAIDSIQFGRENINEMILRKAKEAMPDFGIQLFDVRIKRINYSEQVQKKVYERMISERHRIAEKFRSEGQGLKAEIDGKRQKELQRITSEGYRRAEEIKGHADAEATKIYAEAFGKDPEFYSFLQTLESYKTTLKDNTTLILSTDSEFLKYLKDIRP